MARFLTGARELRHMRLARAVLLYALVVAVTCGSCLHARLQGDDFIWLHDASRIGGVSDLFAVHDVPFAPYDGVRLNPVNTLLLALLWPVFGLQAAPYHGAVLLLYIASGLLVRAWLRCRGAGEPAALCGGLLFLVWPLHAEPVAWLSAVGEVLVGFFSLAALVAWDKASRDERGGTGWVVAAAAAVAGAVLSKEAAFVLPMVLLLSDLLLRDGRVHWRRHLLTGAIAGIAAAWKHGAFAAARVDIGIHPSQLSLSDAAAGTVRYLVHAAAGARLAVSADTSGGAAVVLMAGLVTAIALLARRGYRNAAFHAAWLLVAVQPYVWGVPMQVLQARYAFQPSISLAVMGALAFDAALRRPRRGDVRLVVMGMACVALALLGIAFRDEVDAFSPHDDGNSLQASLRAATRGLGPEDRVYVYNSLDTENAMARAVVLLGGASEGQVHEWYEALNRPSLDRHDRFIYFEMATRRFTDVTDGVQALHACLRGRAATARPRDEGRRAAAWTATDDGLRGAGNDVAGHWAWTPDGMLVLSGLDLSPFALYVLDVEVAADVIPESIALLWTGADCPGFSRDCVAMPSSSRRTANGITLRFMPSDRRAWWTRGSLRALFLRSTGSGPLPPVRAVELYTFGTVR